MSVVSTVLMVLSLLVAGLSAGTFWIFTIAVMPGLDRAGGRAAMAAMNAVNRAIVNPAFLTVFLGGAVLPAAAGVLLFVTDEPAAGWWSVGAAAGYLLLCLSPTVAVNVPMNEALARRTVPDTEEAAAAVWRGFRVRWVRWNTLRAVGGAGTVIAVAMAFLVRG